MKLTINNDSLICFDIDYEINDKTITALLELTNGAWFLTTNPQLGPQWIAGSKMHWSEALRRTIAYLILTK